jgi:hypothetical protein
MNRISTEGASFSVTHHTKSAPTLTSQNANRLARLFSIATGLAGAYVAGTIKISTETLSGWRSDSSIAERVPAEIQTYVVERIRIAAEEVVAPSC